MALLNPKPFFTWATLIGLISTPVAVFYGSVYQARSAVTDHKAYSETTYSKKTDLNDFSIKLDLISHKIDKLGYQIEELQRDNPRRYKNK